MSLTYQAAGVDLAVAEEVTARITARLGNSLFGGFIPVPALKAYDEPVLVSSIDGVGTKVRLAAQLGQVGGLGQDLVHHCVNDIAVHGARPLFFLDYLALHRLEPRLVEPIVASIAGACEALGLVLAGGETAEMPLVYPAGGFDLAGAVVGAVERAAIVDGSTVTPGDLVIGLPSSGLHTNGYSLVQQLFSEIDYARFEPLLGVTLGEALLAPHRCYLSEIEALLATGRVRALAHITGGGIAGNLSRVIPAGCRALLALPDLPPLFQLIEERGVAPEELRRVFNVGIGLIAVVAEGGVPAGWQELGMIERTEAERKVVFHECR